MADELVLCDTNVFIHLFSGTQEVSNNLTEIGVDNIVIPSVSVMELLQGMESKREVADMRKKLSFYYTLDYNEPVSKLAIQNIEEYKLSQNLLIPDAIIGAMAGHFNMKLYTYNIKDFHYMPGIQLYTNESLK
ncbi:MAG: type II toxin-antitoxin system VapC family toxin [Cyclobacteriaceae bacterium]|mgnify:CR=1 FL=1|jgi:predicted nucleic acid-binding protein|nr:type II toxin-antitoxin system VapC family toxin [Cyclobacteriaceae bacterium]